jgi:hypothetical protein
MTGDQQVRARAEKRRLPLDTAQGLEETVARPCIIEQGVDVRGEPAQSFDCHRPVSN